MGQVIQTIRSIPRWIGKPGTSLGIVSPTGEVLDVLGQVLATPIAGSIAASTATNLYNAAVPESLEFDPQFAGNLAALGLGIRGGLNVNKQYGFNIDQGPGSRGFSIYRKEPGFQSVPVPQPRPTNVVRTPLNLDDIDLFSTPISTKIPNRPTTITDPERIAAIRRGAVPPDIPAWMNF